jgi:hypothetical protein
MWGMIYAASAFSMWASILLLPLLIVRRFRGFFGRFIRVLTYVWGFTLWATCFGYILTNYGVFLVVLGCLLGVVGVVPLAIITAFFHHDAHEGWFLVVVVALLLVTRYLAATAVEAAARMATEQRWDKVREDIREPD